MARDYIDPLKVGAILRRYIKAKYHYLWQFANDYGCSERTLQYYLSGGLDSISTLNSIAQFLGIDVWTILHESVG